MDSVTKVAIKYALSDYKLKLAHRIQDEMKKHRGEYVNACADIIKLIADDIAEG